MILAKSMLKYLCGYVTVKISGINKERFINLCHNRNINIWGVKYEEDCFIYNIGIKDFKSIKSPYKKAHVDLKIIERHGLPFFLHKKRKHKVFIAGIVLFALILYVMSCFIWDISLDGGYTYTEEEIVGFLNSNNIFHGMKKKDVKCDDIEKLIRNEYFDITWVSAQLDGTRLIIHIKENFDDLNEEMKENSVCDLVSSKDAVITSIITREGTPLVHVGDEVKSGDILVSGLVEVLDDNKEVKNVNEVSADADVFGKVVYNYNKSFNLKYNNKVYTGNEKNIYFFQIFRGRISTLNIKKYDTFDVVGDSSQLHIFENFYLPVYWGKEKQKEYIFEEMEYTENEAKELAKRELENFFLKMQEKGIQIIANDVKIDVGNGVCITKGKITVIEPIAISSKISLEGKKMK